MPIAVVSFPDTSDLSDLLPFETNGASSAHCISAAAIYLTKVKLRLEAEGHKHKEKALQSALKLARDFDNYRQTSNGWVYDSDDLIVSIEYEDDYIPRMAPRVFCDSDGVAAHFEQQVLLFTGKTVHEQKDEEMWAACGGNAAFWNTMPVMNDAALLWNAIKPLNPTILTGCPKTDYDLAAELKRVWWKTIFDQDDVITCLSRDKALFVRNKHDVLIDDFYPNIKRWRKAGGIGILHKNAETTIAELKNLLILKD